MFTFVEMFDEVTTDFRSINHHGSRRKVFDKNSTEATKKENGYMLPETNMGDVAKFMGRYLFHVTKLINCSYLEKRGLPIFVLIFALSYFVIAFLAYFNLFD